MSARKTTPKSAAKPAKRRPRKTKPKSQPGSSAVDLYEMGARVVSVFGAFKDHVLIEMPANVAEPMFPEPLGRSGCTSAIENAERDIEKIRKRDAGLAESALAAGLVAMARQVEHPYNSATSQSMCMREMRETRDRLWELAPEEEHADSLDELKQARARRRASG